MLEDVIPTLARPHVLWAWLLLPLLALRARGRTGTPGWERFIDAHLIDGQVDRGPAVSRWQQAMPLLGLWLGILALAGPGWGTQPASVQRQQAPLVVVVELSPALLSADLPPSRLLVVRDKLRQLLERRTAGDMALVVYAGDAFTVVPMTADVANIALFVDALSPDIMPVPGQALERALDHAGTLLEGLDLPRARVLVLATHASEAAVAAARRLPPAGVDVSVIAVGPSTGWDMGDLSRVAQAGNGTLAMIDDQGQDLLAAGVLATADDNGIARSAHRQRRDDGPWLLPLVLLLLWPALRRHAGLLPVLLLGPLLAWPGVSQAGGEGMWQRADQQAHARLEAGVAAYHRGDFPAAEAAFRGQDTAVARYNLGNALARQGRLREAVAAYDRALALSPGMEDAVANRKAVLAALERQQKGRGQQPGQPPSTSGQEQSGGQSQAGQGSGKAPPGSASSASPSAGGDTGKGTASPPTDPAQGRPGKEGPGQERSGQEGQGTERPLTSGQRLNDAWLQRVPDDPTALLRRKLWMEHERRQWQR